MASEPRGYAANFVRSMIERGLSATAALREFRAAGGQIQTQTWYRTYGEVGAALANRERASSIPLGRRPNADEVTTWSTRRATGYLYQIEAQVRIRGTSEVFTMQTSYRSDSLIQTGRALQDAMNTLADNLDEYDEVALFGSVVGVHELVPEE